MSLLDDLRVDIGDDDVVITPSGEIGGNLIVGNLCITGSFNMNRRIITASGPVQMADTDGIIFLNKTASESTLVTLPLAPKSGMIVIVKDMKGDADTNFVTIVMSAGTVDGLPQFVMSNNYQSITFTFNGTEWNII